MLVTVPFPVHVLSLTRSGVGNVPGCQFGWLVSREPLQCGLHNLSM